jgi:hypothetical protein
MPNWTINKWAGGIASDEYYGAEGTFKTVSGLRSGQDLRYITPANAPVVLRSFTSGGNHAVKGILPLTDIGLTETLYSTRLSNTTYLWKDSTQVFSTGSYFIENFAPMSISGTPVMIYQTYTGAVYKNDKTDLSGSSWTLTSVGTAAHSSGYGCHNVNVNGGLVLAQGNAIHFIDPLTGTMTRQFYAGDSSMGYNSGTGSIVGVTCFADQVKVYFGYNSPKVYVFPTSELTKSVADTAYASYVFELPNMDISSVANDGPIDYIVGAEHGYPVIIALSGYSTTRVFSGKTRAGSSALFTTLYNSRRGIPLTFNTNKYKNTSLVSGKRLYVCASDSGAPSNNSGRIAVYGGLSQDGIDNGFSLRNTLPGSSESPYCLSYITGSQYASYLYCGTSAGNVYQIPCEALTGSASSSNGYFITRDFDGGMYGMRKAIDEINMGVEIESGSSIEFAISTSSSNQPTYRVIKTFSSTDVTNNRIRVTPKMLSDAGTGYGEFNKVSYRIKLTNGSSTECRLYDIDTKWHPIKL